jgi:hypothetical protein
VNFANFRHWLDQTRDSLLGRFLRVPPSMKSTCERHVAPTVPMVGAFLPIPWKISRYFPSSFPKEGFESILWTC